MPIIIFIIVAGTLLSSEILLIEICTGFAAVVFGFTLYCGIKKKSQQRAPLHVTNDDSNGNKHEPTTNLNETDDCHQESSVQKFIDGSISMPSFEEFERLREKDDTNTKLVCVDGSLKKNERLNLIQDVLPYDYNRVRLQERSANNDYINASWIRNNHTRWDRKPETEERYNFPDLHSYLSPSKINVIVSQDQKNDILDHYYQMIYEQDIKVVVQISDSSIPPNTPPKSIASPNHISKKTINSFGVTCYLTKEYWELRKNVYKPKKVTFLRMTGWPSKEDLTEKTVSQILTTIAVVRKEVGKGQEYVTILAHDDQGGISGAAVFVTLYDLLQIVDTAILTKKVNTDQSKDDQTLNIYDFVRELRKKRDNMIKDFDEYTFLFKALIYYAQNKSDFDKLLRSQHKDIDEGNVTNKEMDTKTNNAKNNEKYGYNIHHGASGYFDGKILHDCTKGLPITPPQSFKLAKPKPPKRGGSKLESKQLKMVNNQTCESLDFFRLSLPNSAGLKNQAVRFEKSKTSNGEEDSFEEYQI